MTNEALQIKFRQRLNKLASNDFDNIECWQIVEAFNLKDLLYEVYILVKHCRFSYSDIKNMSRSERSIFLEFLTKELDEQKNATKQHNPRR